MQAHQDHKETNQSRFQSIDNRWGAVQDAFRIEAQERNQDLSILQDQLKLRKNHVNQVQEKKGEVISQTLKKLGSIGAQSKENIQKLFQDEATFRVGHLQKKNQFIKNFLGDGNTSNSSLQQYATNKIKDVANRLQAIDKVNRTKTEQTVKQIKQDILADTQSNFEKEREKYTQSLGKIANDASRQFDSLRDLLKEKRKKREQSQGLVQQLSKLSETQGKEGQLTYDCLLKLLEECCSKIQEAQLK